MLARFLYKSYSLFYVLRHWRKRHFTPAGGMIIASIIFSGIFGFNILKTNLYQVMAFGVSVMVVALGYSLFGFKLKVSIHRILPEYASIGNKGNYEIQINNLSKKTQKGLILYEEIHDPRPSFNLLLSKEEPFEYKRNIWDRKTLYFRWLWLIQKNQKARFDPIELPDLPAGETICVTATFVPRSRGYIHFSGCTFARPDAMGIFNRLHRVKKYQKILVLPKQYRLETPQLVSTRQYQPGGIRLASSIGDSDEFMSLRNYRPGDPLRNVHWRTFAKTQELVIKEFEDEYFVRHAIILDTILSTGNEIIFESAVSIAASYITPLKTHEAIFDLMFVGNSAHSFSWGRGLGNSKKMLEMLACVEPCDEKIVFELNSSIQCDLKKFSSSICIFLGWEQDHKKVYQLFKQAMVPIFVIVLAENKIKMEEKIFRDKTAIIDIKVVQIDQIQETLGYL
jgi:hypothetical protein